MKNEVKVPIKVPVIIAIITGIFIMPFLIYYIKYDTLMFLDQPEHMGVWGDFVNPFISLINVILFGYITFYIQALDRKREEDKEEIENVKEKNKQELEDKRILQSLDLQRRITISQMQNEKAIDISKALDSIEQRLRDSYVIKEIFISAVITALVNFNANYHYLFPALIDGEEFNEDYLRLVTTLEELELSMEPLQIAIQAYEVEKIEHSKILHNLQNIEDFPVAQHEIERKQNLEKRLIDSVKAKAQSEENQVKLMEKNDHLKVMYFVQKTDFIAKINKYIIEGLEPRIDIR